MIKKFYQKICWRRRA